MQNLDLYPNIKNAQDGAGGVKVNDLICIANLRLNPDENMDETIVSLTDTTVVVEGDYSSITDRYIVIGHEVAYITSASFSSPNTTFQIDREFYGTKKDIIDLTGYFVRTVDVFTDKTTDWSYDDYNGNKSNLFAFNLETGSAKFRDDMSNWVNGSPSQIYKIRKKKNFVYLFNGMNNERMLQKTMLIYQSSTQSSMQRKTEGITLQLYDKFHVWYNQKIGRKDNLLNLYPRELLSNIFQYPVGLVKYINGNVESDFDIVDYAFLNEYTYYKDISLNIVKNGIRFKFNELEEICITSDLTVSNLVVSKSGIINNEILDITASQDESTIINKIDGTYTERRPFYDLSSPLFNNKLLNYNGVINGITHTAITAVDGIYSYNILTVNDSTLFSSVTIGSFVNLREQITGYQFIGKVISFPSTDNIEIFIGYNKDDWMLNFGKVDDLISKGFDTVKTFDLYYQRKQALNFYNYATEIEQINENDDSSSSKTETTTSRMNIPIRPRITERPNQIQYKSSAVKPEQSTINSEEQFTKFFDDIDIVYGEFNNTKLLYNREIEQLDNASYPPYIVFSNRITSDIGRGSDKIIKYNTFDNSNLKITASKSEDSDVLINLKIENDNEISESSLITLLNSEITFLTSRVIQVTLAQYNSLNVGDCITIKEPTSPTSIELRNYNSLKNANYIIQSLYESGGEYFLTTALNLPTNYDFEVYPATEMLFLQELQLWGNPIVEKTAPYTESQAQSVEEFGEKNQVVDGNLLTSEGFAKLIDYYRGFDGLTTSRQKFIVPLTLRDNMDLQKFDIIQFSDIAFTNLSEDLNWIILGIKESAMKNKRMAYCLNLNNYDASSSELDFNFENINSQENLPIYNNNGNEGTANEVETDFDNPDAISTNDKDYGSVKFRPIPIADINATIFSLLSGDRIEIISPNINNLIYSTYLKSVGEYKIIKVDFEYMLCEVTDYVAGTNTTTLQILKRGFCDSNQTRLVVGSEVQFNSIVSLSVFGTDYSENSVVGDTENFSKFSIENGLEIKTNKTVDISNSNNDLLFRPVGDGFSSLKMGKDGNLGEVIFGLVSGTTNYFRWLNGDLSIRGDVKIESGIGYNISFYQDEPPFVGTQHLSAGTIAIIGDSWFDTNDGDKHYIAVASGGDVIGINWILVQDSATPIQALIDISTDSIVTPSEKRIVQQSWRDIQQENTDLTARATAIGYSGTALTNYTNSYNTLNTYLNTTLNVFGDLSTNTNITRVTWDVNWEDYYSKANILKNELDSYSISYTSVKIGDDAVSLPSGGTGDGFSVDTNGHLRLTNTNNDMYFGAGTADSYFKLNKNGSHYEQQIGSGLTSINQAGTPVSFNGMYIGDPDERNHNFMKFDDGGRGGIFLDSRSINAVANVRTIREFIGACDTTASTVNISGLPQLNPYLGRDINAINIVEDIDLTNWVGTDVSPTDNIFAIYSSTGSSINFDNKSLNISSINRTKLSDISLQNIGNGSVAIYIGRTGVIENVDIENLNGKIYGFGYTIGVDIGYVKDLNILSIDTTYGGTINDYIFEQITYMSSIQIKCQSSSIKTLTFFSNCNHINGCEIDYTGSDLSSIFMSDCSFISNINILNGSNSLLRHFTNCNYINNVGILNAKSSSYAFSICRRVSNTFINSSCIIDGASFIQNTDAPLSIILSNIEGDIGNSWNIELKNISSTPTTLSDRDDKCLVNTSTTSVTINLPIPSSYNIGKEFFIKDKSNNASVNNIIINSGGSEFIDYSGNTSLTINSNSGFYRLINDGTNWFTV